MSVPLVAALLIISFAAAFHLYWAMGGRVGYSISLPQRTDGTPVMSHGLSWWRPAAGAVALGLVVLGAVALRADRLLVFPLPVPAAKTALAVAGAAFVFRAIVPTPWTGFFKSIRSTRWALFDTRLYSPLFLLLGVALLTIAMND